LNAQSLCIKFTLEREENKTLPYLDVKITRKNGKLETEVYRKATDSGLYLQFNSNHPKPVKNGIVNTLLHRAETHSSSKSSLNTEVTKIHNILGQNKYPQQLINNIKNKRTRNKDKIREDTKTVGTLALPYVPRLSEKISKIAKKVNVRTVFSAKDILRARLVKLKPDSDRPKTDVIYKIPCECGKSYIGETGRTLETRLNEHKRTVSKGDPNTSKLMEHISNTGHRILWDEAEVIGQEHHWKGRKVQEAAEIYRRGDDVFSSPSVEIHPIWLPMIKKAKFGIQNKKQNYVDQKGCNFKKHRIARGHKQAADL
jgi:hypothetical protein